MALAQEDAHLVPMNVLADVWQHVKVDAQIVVMENAQVVLTHALAVQEHVWDLRGL